MSCREPGAAVTFRRLAASAFLSIFALAAGVEWSDGRRQLGGVSIWAKPLKAQISIAV
jgi:hypothetical protein